MLQESPLTQGIVPISDLGVTLHPGCAESVLKDLFADGAAREIVFNGPWHTYGLQGCSVLGATVNMHICFYSGWIHDIGFALVSEIDEDRLWTPEGLEECGQECREWLTNATGIQVPADFDWGTISVEVERRSWDAGVRLFYRSKRSKALTQV